MYLYFSVGNGHTREPALCQLYRHTFVPYWCHHAVVRWVLASDVIAASYHRHCIIVTVTTAARQQLNCDWWSQFPGHFIQQQPTQHSLLNLHMLQTAHCSQEVTCVDVNYCRSKCRRFLEVGTQRFPRLLTALSSIKSGLLLVPPPLLHWHRPPRSRDTTPVATFQLQGTTPLIIS